MSPLQLRKQPILSQDRYPDGRPCVVLEDPNIDGCLVYADSEVEAARKLMLLREQLTGVPTTTWTQFVAEGVPRGALVFGPSRLATV